ncbi:acyl-CoA synthetase [Mycolicibacterium aubagnense]|uniref:Acyl-CoA ligase n=1 Tax=Mycolicibacterium aubagnense TaxID=319707 RepID=A0ABN5YWF5_9MYCO|nr:acyl-CoA synthetase [Mycolicibacterium aubagnense]TLH68489.1 acyl-CoA synthetase [Mycolicibacterium aubagnense]WGI32225.1 acyl-CoA synthetase [Mycolicibacterium aubagnense]BBX86222.1 putative acyl-CoA ligase [Mycolicibacterium aubagnense]
MFPGIHAQSTPDKPAVIMAGTGRQLTYRELDDSSRQLAVALADLGLAKGDVIAMLSDNAAECFTVYWAALRSGLYLTAVNFHLTADEVAYIVDDCDAKVLIAAGGLGDLAEQVRALVPGVEHAYSFGETLTGFDSYADLLASARDRAPTDQPRGSDMLYSSGTTGRPKGIKPPLLPIQVDEPGDPITGLLGTAFGVTADDVYLSPAPIYHAAPLRWCGAVQAHGGTVVVLERFKAETMLDAIQQYRATVVQVVPTMFVRMLQLSEEAQASYDVSSLRLAVHAAAPCPPDVKQAMIDWWGPILVEYYSSTEACGFTVITSQEWLAKRGSVGRSMLGPVHICSDDGAELAVDEPGLVYFEREVRPFEYHNDPAKTKEAEHPVHDNWTTVGDIGYVDADGYLYLTDRKSFMIISGGVNIYPQEVEDALALHPAVFDVAVIGVPDPVMGQQVKAVVQVRAGVKPNDELAEQLIAHAKSKVAVFKTPRTVDFVETLPRTPTGKLVKRKLVQQYAAQPSG